METEGFRRGLRLERRVVFWDSRPNAKRALTLREATAIAAHQILVRSKKSAELLEGYFGSTGAPAWPGELEGFRAVISEADKRIRLIEGSKAFKNATQKRISL